MAYYEPPATEDEVLSLYFDLFADDPIDVGTLARTLLAWSEAIREIAIQVDPSLTVNVGLLRTAEGSLSIDTLVKHVSGGHLSTRSLKTVVAGAALFVSGAVADWSVGKLMDWLSSSETRELTRGMNSFERQELAEDIVRLLHSKNGDKAVRAIFREAQKDWRINGLGATTELSTRPSVVIDRARFALRADPPEDDTELRTRTREENQEVVLLQPTLVASEKLKWKFRSVTGEFFATIHDSTLLRNIRTGDVDMPMIEGLKMKVVLRIEEERSSVEEPWQPRAYAVLKVESWTAPAQTIDMDLDPPPKG